MVTVDIGQIRVRQCGYIRHYSVLDVAAVNRAPLTRQWTHDRYIAQPAQQSMRSTTVNTKDTAT